MEKVRFDIAEIIDYETPGREYAEYVSIPPVVKSGDYYRAPDVDAYRQAVKALVEAARAVVKEYDPEFAVRNAWDDLHVAIAAVERLEVE